MKSKNKNVNSNETLILMVKLGIICIIVSGLLAYVNSVTAPVISANDQKTFEASMSEVLPDGGSFSEENINFTPKESGVELSSIYKAENGGYVATTVCHEGYGGDITVMVGIKNDMTVNKIKIMSLSETAGLGAKSNTPEFMNQYDGLKSGIKVEKNNGGNAADNSISAISGATITSKAVTKAVNCALEAAETGGASK